MNKRKIKKLIELLTKGEKLEYDKIETISFDIDKDKKIISSATLSFDYLIKTYEFFINFEKNTINKIVFYNIETNTKLTQEVKKFF